MTEQISCYSIATVDMYVWQTRHSTLANILLLSTNPLRSLQAQRTLLADNFHPSVCKAPQSSVVSMASFVMTKDFHCCLIVYQSSLTIFWNISF